MYGNAKAFADDNAVQEENLSVQVYLDNTRLKTYDAAKLKAIAAQEGNQEYTYSAFNTYPTARTVEKVTGPTVQGILNDALKDNTADPDIDTVGGIGNNWLIQFKAKDGVSEWFTKDQLFKGSQKIKQTQGAPRKTSKSSEGGLSGFNCRLTFLQAWQNSSRTALSRTKVK